MLRVHHILDIQAAIGIVVLSLDVRSAAYRVRRYSQAPVNVLTTDIIACLQIVLLCSRP